MSSEMVLPIGQPLKLLLPHSNSDNKLFSSRVISETPHTLLISIPYDTGKLVLWPVGTKLQVEVSQGDNHYIFTVEIIGRDLGDIKTYTIMRPNSISLTTQRVLQTGMSRVIAITSGKGGVGKTTLTINLAITLAAQGKRVFIIDADLGTANVDVLLKLNPKYNITHLLSGEKNLLEIAVSGPGNIVVIPGGSGLQELTQLSKNQFAQVITSFNQLDGLADIILVDTGAGISRDVSNFLLAADEVITITTPEPHAITDAYALIKVMKRLQCPAKKMLIINKAENSLEAINSANRLLSVVKNYLQYDLQYIGHVSEDRLVSRSLKEQIPLVLTYPASNPSKDIHLIANKLLDKPIEQPQGIGKFISKMFNLFTQKNN